VPNPGPGQRLHCAHWWCLSLQTAAPEWSKPVFREGKTDHGNGLRRGRATVPSSQCHPRVRRRQGRLVFEPHFGPNASPGSRETAVPRDLGGSPHRSQRRVVASSRDAERRVGKPVVRRWFAAAMRASDGSGDRRPVPMIARRPGQIASERLHESPGGWWPWPVPVAELQSAARFGGSSPSAGNPGLLAVGHGSVHGPKNDGTGEEPGAGERGLAPRRDRRRRVADRYSGNAGTPASVPEASTAVQAHTEERERNAEALRQANETLEARVAERTRSPRHCE